jgi:peptide/nickel transport system ATP-binding protein
MSAPLLDVEELTVVLDVDGGAVVAPDRVSFGLAPGATLGLVGESGSGKSVTLRTIVGLESVGKVRGGRVSFEGRDLTCATQRELEAVRGARIGMIFQEAGAALDPVLSIGAQLMEVLRRKRGLDRRQARRKAIELLERVGIPTPELRLRAYPHQLSGGLQQRVMIAIAIACEPVLLLADEPTTALDVTIQDQILRLLEDLREQSDMAMLLVSHDLAIVAQMCDTVAVMYAGQILECGPMEAVTTRPRHPYTEALLASADHATDHVERGRFASIPGQPPDLTALPAGCPFAPRCRYADERCTTTPVKLDAALPAHGTACLFPERMER